MMIKVNFLKNLSQGLFVGFIAICTFWMIFNLSKNHSKIERQKRNQSIPYSQSSETKSLSTSIPEDVLKSLRSEDEVKPKSQIVLDTDALKQLNESINSAANGQIDQVRANKMFEPMIAPKKSEKSTHSILNQRCMYQNQPYLPGDLLKTERGWMRCAQVFDFSKSAQSENVSWVEVR